MRVFILISWIINKPPRISRWSSLYDNSTALHLTLPGSMIVSPSQRIMNFVFTRPRVFISMKEQNNGNQMGWKSDPRLTISKLNVSPHTFYSTRLSMTTTTTAKVARIMKQIFFANDVALLSCLLSKCETKLLLAWLWSSSRRFSLTLVQIINLIFFVFGTISATSKQKTSVTFPTKDFESFRHGKDHEIGQISSFQSEVDAAQCCPQKTISRERKRVLITS